MEWKQWDHAIWRNGEGDGEGQWRKKDKYLQLVILQKGAEQLYYLNASEFVVDVIDEDITLHID